MTEKPSTKEQNQKLQEPIGFLLQSLEERMKNAPKREMKIDFSKYTPDERAEILWAMFQLLKGLVSGRESKKNDQVTENGLKKMYQVYDTVFVLYHDRETHDAYEAGLARHTHELEAINGNFEKYQLLRAQLAQEQSVFDTATRTLFGKRNTGPDEMEILLFENSKTILKKSREELEKLIKNNPDLGALVQYHIVREYSRQFQKEKFMWSESRRELLEEIEVAALSGKPVLISGESGTGKTRLVEQTSLKLTGLLAAQTAGKDVRFEDLIAKPKIDKEKGTYYEYKALGEAATGKETTRDDKPRHQGRILADDEFNVRPENDQTEMLARIAAMTPGKMVKMPVTGAEERITPHFLYCAMVNLSSQRYSRKKIPPEVLRKFAKVDVGYPPQSDSNPELYEMMLASLLDQNGRLRVASAEVTPEYEYEEKPRTISKNGRNIKETVRVRTLLQTIEEKGKPVRAGGFLWRFAQALDQINKSFSRQETVLNTKGEAQFLNELIIDMGDILSWLREYTTLARSKDMETFIVEKLNSQFLERAAYTSEDRQLIKEFLAYFGIDTNGEPREKTEVKIMTPVAIGLLSPRVHFEQVVQSEPQIGGVFIDSEGTRIEYDLKPLVMASHTFEPGAIITRKNGTLVKFLGVARLTGSPVVEPYTVSAPKESQKKDFPKYNERSAEKLGLKLVELKGYPKADSLIGRILPANHGAKNYIDITTPKGQTQFITEWKKDIPDVPLPCAEGNPGGVDGFWYLKQLASGKIVDNVSGTPREIGTFFGNEEKILIDTWEEKDYDATDAATSHQSLLLEKLLGKGKKSTVKIKRQDIDSLLWEGDPSERKQSAKASSLIQELGFNPKEVQLRLITQEEYVRLAPQMGLGQKNLVTMFDNYYLRGDGDRIGLYGGNRGVGGASCVSACPRVYANANLSVRLVLARIPLN